MKIWSLIFSPQRGKPRDIPNTVRNRLKNKRKQNPSMSSKPAREHGLKRNRNPKVKD